MGGGAGNRVGYRGKERVRLLSVGGRAACAPQEFSVPLCNSKGGLHPVRGLSWTGSRCPQDVLSCSETARNAISTWSLKPFLLFYAKESPLPSQHSPLCLSQERAREEGSHHAPGAPKAGLRLLKGTGQRPATSPPRMPGARALAPAPRPPPCRPPPAAWAPAGLESRGSRLQLRDRGRGCSGRSASPRDLGLQIRGAVRGRREPAGTCGSAHAPGPGLARRGQRSGVGLGGAPGSAGARGEGGGLPVTGGMFPARGSPPVAPAARRLPRPPRARALARPARVPRAPPLCDSLTSPAGLPASVWTFLCSAFNSPPTCAARPACLPGLEAGPLLPCRSLRPPPPLRAAVNPPSPPPGPPDRRHTHLKLVPRVCGINFPEATSPPEEVDRQLGIYMWVSLQVALEQDGLVRKEADFGRGNFLFFF